jgi:riboflavin synthase
VCLDGTSLTVCEVKDIASPPFFTIMLVNYTQNHVILPNKKVGDTVNLEVDMVGKYVERCLLISDNGVPHSGGLGAYVQSMVSRLIAENAK